MTPKTSTHLTTALKFFTQLPFHQSDRLDLTQAIALSRDTFVQCLLPNKKAIALLAPNAITPSANSICHQHLLFALTEP